MEIIIQIIACILLDIPGAIILYLFKGKKIKFQELYDNDYMKERVIGVLFWFVFGITIAYSNY